MGSSDTLRDLQERAEMTLETAQDTLELFRGRLDRYIQRIGEPQTGRGYPPDQSGDGG